MWPIFRGPYDRDLAINPARVACLEAMDGETLVVFDETHAVMVEAPINEVRRKLWEAKHFQGGQG